MKAKTFLITACCLCCVVAAALTACTRKAPQQPQPAAAAAPPAPQYADIELPSPYGALLRVSDYVAKNRYTLVDFWASWCGPCRREMPTVVKAYADYHEKGFEVVGVSLDNNREAWIKAIDELNMPWPQMSDLKGWDCAGAQLYNVQSIPSNLLIDQQGRIVARDLRGDDLLQTLAGLMARQ